MATLLELHTIEANSLVDQQGATGDVLAAIQLRQRVRTAVLKQSHTALNTPLPTDDAQRGDALERLAWAQDAAANPDGMALPVFRLMLAANASATTTQILNASDAQIEAVIVPTLGLLAKGLHPGR